VDRGLLANYAENRSRFYWFLGDFYIKKPDTAFINDIKSQISKIGQGSDGDLDESLAIVEEILEDTNIEEVSNRLLIEFTRLFRGIKKGYGIPPPYESIYRGERRVIGQVTLDVMKIYRDVGFDFSGNYSGPQDYLGVELKFMAFLCQNEMDAWKNNNDDKAKKYIELEKTFLNMHLLQIISKFSRNVINKTREKFYIGVVKLTEKFTTMDADTIDYLLSNLRRNLSTTSS
jgi:TorA maturation chaperone TorD